MKEILCEVAEADAQAKPAYRLSRDYAALYEFICAGNTAAGWVDYQVSPELPTWRDLTALDAMPESLQSGATGELLQERIDACDSTISELESAESELESAISDIAELETERENASDERRAEIADEIEKLADAARDQARSIDFPE